MYNIGSVYRQTPTHFYKHIQNLLIKLGLIFFEILIHEKLQVNTSPNNEEKNTLFQTNIIYR